jgi:hypothetical protein
MTFSTTIYSRLKTNLRKKYQKDLRSTLQALEHFPKLKINRWLTRHSDELTDYSPLRWYFLKQLQTLHTFMSAHTHLSDDPEEFGTYEDIIFEKWNQSEFAQQFLKNLNQVHSVKKASEKTAIIFDQHLCALAERHFLFKKKIHPAYRPQYSLGEKIKKKEYFSLLKTTLHFKGKDLTLMTSTLKEMKVFSQRIEDALLIIMKCSPSSWERFQAFTEVIIPIKEPELVSYSHQELPGTSMINLYHRDFIDLMDDLLHENGHHHLNYYLNQKNLIEEPLDCIYFSPWRRTLRPLRGVYHAYFTFFWAFKLFADLSLNLDQCDHSFTAAEKEKIIWRAVEEYYMLKYAYLELQGARKEGLIYDLGWKLLEEQQKELMTFTKQIPVWEKKLKIHKKELKDLKSALKKAEKDYLK